MAAPATVQLEVHPHRAGPWLVRVGGVRYAVPSRVGSILLPHAGHPVGCVELTTLLTNELEEVGKGWAQRLTEPGRARPGRPIWIRIPLLSAKKTIILSKYLSCLTRPGWLVFLVLVGLLGYAHAASIVARVPGVTGLGAWLLAFGLFLGSAVWHELGHASALQREGYPPGGIGVGILFVVPVLFADVTAMTALPRAGRLRVDVAGVCFQLGAGGVLAALAPLAGAAGPSFRLASLAALGAVFWSLLPFMRSDGYWVLCDLLGLADLDSPPPATGSRWLPWLVGIFRVANALFMVAVALWVPLRVHGLLTGLALRGGLDPETPLVRISALAAAMFLLVGVGLAAARRLRRLALS